MQQKMTCIRKWPTRLYMIAFAVTAAIGANAETIVSQNNKVVLQGATWTYDTYKIWYEDEVVYARITSVSRDIMGDVTLPSVLGGCDVRCTQIGAFAGCTNLTSVTIPSCLTNFTFGARAFENCPKLAAVHVADLETWLNLGFDYHFSDSSVNYTCNP